MPVVAVDAFNQTFPIESLSWPATKGVAVTPSDTDDLVNVSRALWVGGAGTLKVTLKDDADGTSVTFAAVPAGTLMPLRVKRVWTASTATLILAIQ